MNEFWSFCRENKEAILTIGTALATGLGTALGFLIRSNVVNLRKIRAAKRQAYTIRCPHCKKETPINEVTFLMPSGKVDNNLNGIPDDEE